MPPRRSHKKSRAGCRRCKARKIKCDEIHPRCGNCTKHGVPCDFEYPELAESLAAAETPQSAQPTSPDVSASGSTPRSPSVAMTFPNSRPMPLYRTPEQPLVSSNAKNNRILEMKLLHHYTTITCKTLVIRDGATIDDSIWRDTVPNLAFSGASFLADALLSVAALHLRTRFPHDQQLIRASHSYMASTLSEYSASLSKGINESNAEALFLTAALIAFQSTASRIFTRDDSGDLKDRADGYVLPLSWFHSFQGVKAVVASSWQWLRNSGVVIPIIEAQPALNLNLGEHETSYFGYLLDGLTDELTMYEPGSADQVLVKQAYQHAVAVLNWAHKIPRTGAPLVFLATVSRRFIELLEARQPRSLAILACYFGLLKVLDGVWWMKGVARREIMGIVSLFDPDDEIWWPRLQWPLRIALFEGEIPPDVWGCDYREGESLMIMDRNGHGNAGGGFVSHIELLTKMFTAMQNNVASNLPDVLDMLAHGDAVLQERAFNESEDPGPASHNQNTP